MHAGEQIGSEPTLPYLNPELDGERLLNGANFASAGIGILNDTGIQFVSHLKFYYTISFCFSHTFYLEHTHHFSFCSKFHHNIVQFSFFFSASNSISLIMCAVPELNFFFWVQILFPFYLLICSIFMVN